MISLTPNSAADCLLTACLLELIRLGTGMLRIFILNGSLTHLVARKKTAWRSHSFAKYCKKEEAFVERLYAFSAGDFAPDHRTWNSRSQQHPHRCSLSSKLGQAKAEKGKSSPAERLEGGLVQQSMRSKNRLLSTKGSSSEKIFFVSVES